MSKPKRIKLTKGMKVIVKQDIYRLEELHERIDKLPPKPPFPKRADCSEREFYKALFEYNRQTITYKRQYVLYAKQGEEGTVIDCFKVVKYKYKKRVDYYAKVQIGDKIKTFRYGSLDII